MGDDEPVFENTTEVEDKKRFEFRTDFGGFGRLVGELNTEKNVAIIPADESSDERKQRVFVVTDRTHEEDSSSAFYVVVKREYRPDDYYKYLQWFEGLVEEIKLK